MIENKEKIYEIILTIAVFFFLLFNISILRTYFVYAVYVGDLIYLLLFFLEFIVSFLLSYKFYKTIQSKLSSRIKDILLTVFVTIVFYAYLLVFWIFILAMFSKIAPYIPNVLGAILSLILIMLIPMSFLFTLFLSYRFYLYVASEELYKVLKAQEKNFLKRDQEQTIKYYEHNSQLRDKWDSQKTKFLLAYVIAVIIILAINSFLSLGIDLRLLLKGLFLLSIVIFVFIYDKKVFVFFMIILGWMGLVFLFNSLGHNGFLGLTVNQTDAISGVLLVVGTTIAIVVATFWLKYNV
ncbi:hypothetical protein [uncultured Methanobrevibacter sp.]|uniref:hypothetical protein n=1 Tax=uncultured Methanobrevibacter sp. TaxID=253161 RepID=UPI0026352503|nr:hypothetical protein [uncultured Methanobrevibacter sp.]